MADIHTKNSPHAKKNYTFIGYTVDNSQSKRNISKNEEVEELKEQENSPENKQINNETGLYSLKDTEFKKEIMKILKELRKATTEKN